MTIEYQKDKVKAAAGIKGAAARWGAPTQPSIVCELCPRQAKPGDILCHRCAVNFDEHGAKSCVPAESIDRLSLNIAAANWIRDTYGPMFSARWSDDIGEARR